MTRAKRRDNSFTTAAGAFRARFLAHAAPVLGHASRAALDLIFPPACLNCRQATQAHGSLCAACWSKIRFIERPFCERLGVPFSVDLGNEGLLSPEAVANPPVYGRARAVAHFDDGPVRHLVHRLKYGDRMELAKPLGAWMARAGAELLVDADLIAPVPLHRRRLFARRFNQAEALARSISSSSGVPEDPLCLVRVKETQSQVRLTRSQRALNVQGAFRVPEEMAARIEGRAIVLVDDVMTSGSTVNAASRALLRAKARRVDVLVFARVV
ncbi:ComF family protein [Methylocella tundrae]|uniref:Phosphoribosyltransferase n=1 Tax=Methylocella tundrae TaxID=227605 RepID=A0A4U8Z1S7_METTU|nr:ComF family protein [Methylocella tundrae]WPP03241.1 ComF family protein [Methylocella tundrae]VFU09244.1 Phosphoribosyltransferase [Methylocella tundrae]